MHIVHYLSNYTDFATAKDKSEGLAVVAILFEVSLYPVILSHKTA